MKIIMRTDDVLPFFKSKSDLAKKIGISRQALTYWGDIVPETSAVKLLLINPDLPHEIQKQQTPNGN